MYLSYWFLRIFSCTDSAFVYIFLKNLNIRHAHKYKYVTSMKRTMKNNTKGRKLQLSKIRRPTMNGKLVEEIKLHLVQKYKRNNFLHSNYTFFTNKT